MFMRGYFNENFFPFGGVVLGGLTLLVILDLVLRGVALWRAAKNSQQYWFIALLIVNSMGILPLVYILFFDKSRKKNKKK